MHSSSCIRKYRDTVEHYVLVLSSGLSIKEGDLELLLSYILVVPAEAVQAVK